MNRCSFMRAILAAGIAPYVSTAAGVLMPVRPLWTPPRLMHGELGTVWGMLFRVTSVVGDASKHLLPPAVDVSAKWVPGPDPEDWRACFSQLPEYSFTMTGSCEIAKGDLIRIEGLGER